MPERAGAKPIQDLLERLARVEELGELIRVGQPVDCQEEMSAISYLQAREHFHGLVAHLAVGARAAPHAPTEAVPFGDAERHVVEQRQLGEQARDLERAAEPALDARLRRQPRNVFSFEQDRTGRRAQVPGQHVDEAGLARPVWADEIGRASCRERV